jgi:hypothetical protein
MPRLTMNVGYRGDSVANSKVASARIFGEVSEREAIVDSFNLSRVAEEDYGERFKQGMSGYSAVQSVLALEALQGCDLSGIRTFCDVAGGHGHLMCAILQAYSRSRSAIECRLLALFGHAAMSDLSPLFSVKRKSGFGAAKSQLDPKRTWLGGFTCQLSTCRSSPFAFNG